MELSSLVCVNPFSFFLPSKWRHLSRERSSLPGQTLQARLTGDEREREGGSADSEQDSVIQWNVYYVMTTLNLNCACDPCVTSYYRISTESHDCCNLIGSANIPAEPTETCSESADSFSLSLVPFSSSPCISLVPSKARSEGLPRETRKGHGRHCFSTP